MTKRAIFIPLLLCSGGLPLAAHALPIIELPAYEGGAMADGLGRVGSVRGIESTPWLTLNASATAAGTADGGFIVVAAGDRAETASAAQLPATAVPDLLDDLRLADGRTETARGGWTAQLAAGLLAVCLVARRRLAVR